MKRQLISKLMLLAAAGAFIWTGCSTTETRSASTTPYNGLDTVFTTRPELSKGLWATTQGRIMKSPALLVDRGSSTLVVGENRLLAKAMQAEDGDVFEEGAGASISTDAGGAAEIPFYRAVIR